MESSKKLFEPLTDSSETRLSVLPIKYPVIWSHYKKQQAAYWTAEEIDFGKDADDFKKLNSNEQHFIKMVLGFFSSSDTIVNINLLERFTSDVKVMEAQVTYSFQAMIENVHAEVYSLMIDNIIKDKKEKNKLFNAVENFPCINKKAKWAMKWITSNSPFAMRLIAFAIVEGIFFSGSFCSIFWLKKKNLMPGLCDSNELIARDESMHTEFACILYSMIKNKINTKQVHDMFKEAVSIEKEFICDSLPCSLLGMNKKHMSQYIEFVADRLLLQLGYSKIWNSTNPFDFMESISMEGKTNFFEHRPTQYQNANVLNQAKENMFEVDDDF